VGSSGRGLPAPGRAPERGQPSRRPHARSAAAPTLAAAVYLALVTSLARVSGWTLLLFPELGALTTVVFTQPQGSWARAPRLLVLTPTLTAVTGLLISRSLAYSPLAVLLALVAALVVIRLLRSPVAPAISAGVLPLALGITSWHYPLAILSSTGGLALLVLLRARLSAAPLSMEGVTAQTAAREGCSRPIASGRNPAGWLLPLAAFLAGGLLLVQLLRSPLVLYPPLLVMAWEMLVRPQHCPWAGRAAAVLIVSASAAAAGLLLVRYLGAVPLATLLAVLITALLLRLARLNCPPVHGLALLPLVIPSPPLSYPLLTLAGTAWLLIVEALQRALVRRRCGREWEL